MALPPKKELFAIVDYANIHSSIKMRGLEYIVSTLTLQIPPNFFITHNCLVYRFYGGWYQDNLPTRLAQKLIGEIGLNYPQIINISGKSINVGVELVYGLALLPTKHLFYTYRQRSKQAKLTCIDPVTLGCACPDCPMIDVFSIIKNDACTKCGRSLDEFILLDEQKLVDCMMTADLIHYAQHGETNAVLVTADDDLWPGILTANSLKMDITHINPGKSRSRAFGSYSKFCDASLYRYIQI